MASKEAIRVVCYCLEHPAALEDEAVAKLYESAKKEIAGKKAKKDKLTWYDKKEIYFETRKELEEEIKSLILAGNSNVAISSLLKIDVKAVAYVKRKYKLFKPTDITKEELEKKYRNESFGDICEELGISGNKLMYMLKKHEIQVKHPVNRYRVKATSEAGEVNIFDTTAEAAEYIGMSKSGLSHRLKTGKFYNGIKVEKVY